MKLIINSLWECQECGELIEGKLCADQHKCTISPDFKDLIIKRLQKLASKLGHTYTNAEVLERIEKRKESKDI